MTSFVSNVNLPHPNSKVVFGSLTVIPNEGEVPVYMEEIPNEMPVILHTSKSRKFGSIARANRSRIFPVDEDGFQFDNVPVLPINIHVNCCIVS
jgi:hypothetical protein